MSKIEVSKAQSRRSHRKFAKSGAASAESRVGISLWLTLPIERV